MDNWAYSKKIKKIFPVNMLHFKVHKQGFYCLIVKIAFNIRLLSTKKLFL
jgi:hypothetical protein